MEYVLAAAGVVLALVVLTAAVISYRREGWIYRLFNRDCTIPTPDELFPDAIGPDVDTQRLARQLCYRIERTMNSAQGRNRLREGTLIINAARRRAPQEVVDHIEQELGDSGWHVVVREYPGRIQFHISRPPTIPHNAAGLTGP